MVQEFRFNQANIATKATFVSMIGSDSNARSLHGLFIWAHGYNRINNEGVRETGIWIERKDGDIEVAYSDMSDKMRYKLGLAIVNACYSAVSRPVLISPNGKFGGSLSPRHLVDPLHPMGVPLKDLTGKKGIKYEWKRGKSALPAKVQSVIRPGEQGTNPRAVHFHDIPGPQYPQIGI